MANSREIRKRIKSVGNIAQITKAMELVAASRMRRAQDTALAGRRYNYTMYAMLRNLLAHTDPNQHALLRQYEANSGHSSVLVVVFGPDKGLCGGLIGNLLREVARFKQQNQSLSLEYLTMGKKAREVVRKLGGQIVADVPLREKPTLSDVVPMTQIVLDEFMSGKYQRVVVVNTRFISTLKQQAQIKQLLPLSEELLAQAEARMSRQPEVLPSEELDYLYEPGVDAVLSALLPRAVEMSIFQALLEALASEYSARMIAMKNAGDNAHDLQQELTLTYNQLRQASITAELAEIASASSL
jgi:F-type H+-transporting ATPase subunit gamma